MNCKAVDQILSSYADGELSGREMRLVREHLSGCAECSAELEMVLRLKRCIAALPDAECEPDLEDRLIRAIYREQSSQRSRFKLVFAGGLAFVGAFALATVWLQGSKAQAVEASNQVARSGFELDRDQAYLAGSDPLAGNTVILTSSHGLR